MARWRHGEATIEQMLRDGELEQVPADAEAADHLVHVAGRHIQSATSLGSAGRHSPLTRDEVDEAVEVASSAHEAATQLLALEQLGVF